MSANRIYIYCGWRGCGASTEDIVGHYFMHHGGLPALVLHLRQHARRYRVVADSDVQLEQRRAACRTMAERNRLRRVK